MRLFCPLFVLLFIHTSIASTGQFVERNFNRWAKQYKASQTKEIPSMDRLMEWIPQHLPPNEKVTVVHGDFRYWWETSDAVGQCLTFVF